MPNKIKYLNLFFLCIVVLFWSFHSYAQDDKKYTTYIVKEKKTLRKIAREVGCKLRVLKRLNPGVRRKPPINTVLVIPNKNYGKNVPEKIIPPQPKNKDVFYTIKGPEDTLYKISKEYNVSIQAIKEANPEIAKGLYPEQKIRIPIDPDNIILYKVKKGDTQWSITKAHNISLEELEKLNTELQGNALRENDILRIRIHLKEHSTKEIDNQQGTDFIYHEVQQSEGLFRIAKTYNTTQEIIEQLNPGVSENLQPGVLLRIPKNPPPPEFVLHTVIKDDTLYSLTHKYQVSEETLFHLNPELKNGLALGMTIKIKPIGVTTVAVKQKHLTDHIATNQTLRLSFMMPLMMGTDSSKYSDNTLQLRNICAEFFMGAEIAIDSLKKQGLQLTYHIYDTENNPLKIYNLLSNSELKKSHAIIGPFYYKNAKRIAMELFSVPVMMPLYSKKQDADKQANLIKTATDKKRTHEELINYLSNNYKKENIIIISDNNPKNKNIAKRIEHLLKSYNSITYIRYITPSHNRKRPEQIYIDKALLTNSVVKEQRTWVVLISDDAIVNSDVVNHYGAMAYDTPIRLFTAASFTNFEHLNYSYLAALQWTFPSVQFTMLNSESIRRFKAQFRKKNFANPTSYAFTGFDLTYDTLIRLSVDNDFTEGLEAGISRRLSHLYNYQKTNKGDYKNQGVFFVKFNKEMNYELVK